MKQNENFDPSTYKPGRQPGESTSDWLERVNQLMSEHHRQQAELFAAEVARQQAAERARVEHEQLCRELEARSQARRSDSHHNGEYEPKTNLGAYLKYFWDQMTG